MYPSPTPAKKTRKRCGVGAILFPPCFRVWKPTYAYPYPHRGTRRLTSLLPSLRIAFRFIHSLINTDTSPRVRIEVLSLPNTPTDPNSRLYRTCLALLETLHRYGWGAMTNYKKRVQHDCLFSREAYQDLYLVMRERHKGLVDTWQEVTDPLKHVFEVCVQVLLYGSYLMDSVGYWDRNLLDALVEGYLFAFGINGGRFD